MSFIDCHVHLQHPAFAADLPAVLSHAASAGVNHLVCNGAHEADWPRVAELAQSDRRIIPCFGLHPWFISNRSANWEHDLEHFLKTIPSGVGEIGIDRWIEPRDEPAQEHVFRIQLDLARRFNRPAMVHCLRAWDWLMRILRDQPPFSAGLLIHAYGGSVDLIQPLAEMGAYFSFAGNVLEPRRTKARQTLVAVPPHRLLIETDAPDMLPPEPFRPYSSTNNRNEPANLPAILRGVAQILAEPEEQLAARIQDNARRLLGGLID